MGQRGINKVILLGNLGDEPEMRYAASGDAIANITIATSERWKDQQGQQQEKTEWHRCVAFKRLAEVVGQYCHKGTKVYIEGKLRTRKWQDKNNQDRYTTEIVIKELQLLGDGQNNAAQKWNEAPKSGLGSNNAQPPSQRQPQQPNDPLDSYDDDIPF